MDTILRRRDMIVQDEQPGTPYHLEQGIRYSGSKYVSVSGNHVETTILDGFIGVTPLGIGVEYVNNQPVWFTIPSGSSCVIEYKNISFTGDTPPNTAVNFRKANTSSSVSGTGTGNFYPGQVTHKTVNFTAGSDVDVGSLFIYVQYGGTGTVSFDFEFYVDGLRWI